MSTPSAPAPLLLFPTPMELWPFLSPMVYWCAGCGEARDEAPAQGTDALASPRSAEREDAADGEASRPDDRQTGGACPDSLPVRSTAA